MYLTKQCRSEFFRTGEKVCPKQDILHITLPLITILQVKIQREGEPERGDANERDSLGNSSTMDLLKDGPKMVVSGELYAVIMRLCASDLLADSRGAPCNTESQPCCPIRNLLPKDFFLLQN